MIINKGNQIKKNKISIKKIIKRHIIMLMYYFIFNVRNTINFDKIIIIYPKLWIALLNIFLLPTGENRSMKYETNYKINSEN